MVDKVKTQDATREEIALTLCNQIAAVEELATTSNKKTFRKQYLDLYAECLKTVARSRSGK